MSYRVRQLLFALVSLLFAVWLASRSLTLAMVTLPLSALALGWPLWRFALLLAHQSAI